MLNGWTYVAKSRSGRSFKACNALLAQTGFRGSEVSLSSGKTFNLACINRASIVWRIGGVDYPSPSAKQLRSMKEGDFVLIIPPPSKCDRFGIAWGSDPIYLAWHPSKPICAARLLTELELAFPCEPEDRKTTPLFTFDDGSMFTRPWLQKQVKEALLHIGVEPERVATLTLHSYRRYLACALLATNASDATICALLRWRSAKSLAAYAAMNDAAYATLIDAAADATINSIRTANIGRVPVTSETDVAYGLSRGMRSATAAAEAQTEDEIARADAMDETI